jgi:hypothetical protein
MRIEWRSRAEGDDSLLAIEDDTNTVVQAWPVDPSLLVDFLNDMDRFAPSEEGDAKLTERQRDAIDWGELVISRSADGEVIEVDPELYWVGVAIWFRSRGNDPHPWGNRH